MKKHFVIRKSFMIFITYFLVGSLFAFYGADRHRFKGPKFQAPETTQAIGLFKQKCIEYKVQDVCAQGFQNLVRIDLVDKVWYQFHLNSDVTTIGLTEYSAFSPLTKISIDRRLIVDRFLFDSTVIHELGHAVLNLDHKDDKPRIMNTMINDSWFLKQNYDKLVDEMFEDFAKNLK